MDRLYSAYVAREVVHEDVTLQDVPSVVKAGNESLGLVLSYADAFGENAGPTAHLLPAGIIIQELVLKVFGFKTVGYSALIILSCLWVAIGLALLPKISVYIFSDAKLGFLAGLVGAIFPFNWYTQ